jgi:V/A-type H+-transporting ATPase subunit C
MAMQKEKLYSLGQANWPYINARIRGMKSELISHEKLENILKQPDIDSIIDELRKTPHAPFVEEAEKKYITGLGLAEVLSLALKNSLIATTQKLRRMMEGEQKELLNLLLRRWDVYNLKTVLRGKYRGCHYAEISQNLLPIGEYSEEYFEELSKISDLREIVNTMLGADARCIEEGWRTFSLTGNLLNLELELDNWFYTRSLHSAYALDEGAKARTIFKMEIDIANAMMTIRLAKAGVDPANVKKFFLKNGMYLNEIIFNDLATKNDVGEVLRRLSEYEFCKAIASRIPIYKRIRDISIFERALYGHLLRRIRELFRVDVLGTGLLLTYLELKFNEITNLRIIIRSKEYGMPDEIARGELIFV